MIVMALLQDLIQQIDDPALRERILRETNKLVKQKKFGLVFEEHMPECTPLYDVPIRVGAKVALKTGYVSDIYTILKIDGNNVLCDRRETHQEITFQMDEIVVVAEFGEPIYPTLQPLDYVENAPESDLWHTLIEADNYHALQLLEYLYAGKVDCIYIDPPYNSGAKDWKYNNDYVDSSDAYRHSKWLSMMEKRLKLAKKLLNHEDSVLIVTIDEKEYLHLGCLLEEMFPEARIQMISDVINPRGATRDGSFSRSDEYIYLVQLGTNSVFYPKAGEKHYVEWYRLRRTDHESRRGTVKGGTQQFYPIYVDIKTEKIVHIGDPLPIGQDRRSVPSIEGAIAVFPVKNDGTEMNWGVTPETLRILLDNHFVRVRKNSKGKPQPYLIHYISYVQLEAIKQGRASIEGYNDDGTAIVIEDDGHIIRPGSAWNIPSHNAGTYGSEILAAVIGEKRFTFPKSIYSVLDDFRYFLSGKPHALIVDFFAGSGTTLHAVNLLNAEDGGRRRCIMVTNNEVSANEAKELAAKGLKPGDTEWDKLGIARYVTWPRTVNSIQGHDINGKPLQGDYGVESECYEVDNDVSVVSTTTGKPVKKTVYRKVKRQLYPELSKIMKANGFKANAVFFKFSFLDKTAVALGRQFKELLPVLWMKGGAVGKCPELDFDELPNMLILPENKMAVLIDEIYYPEFDAQIEKYLEVQTVFIVTDSESAYREMIRTYEGRNCYQLYRDYLDNFRINTGR